MNRMLGVLSFWTLFGCSSPTGALVHVETELGTDVFDRYFVRVQGDGTSSMFGPFMRAEVDPHPTFGVAPRGGDPTRSALITVEGHLEQGMIVATQMTLPSFMKGRILDVHMFLGPRIADDAGVAADVEPLADADPPDVEQRDADQRDSEPLDVDPNDAGVGCPPECTSCDPDGTCAIVCGSGECNTGITCPSGRPCRVDCAGDSACETARIDCSMATRCAINCIGSDACDSGGIVCGGEICTVVCQGGAACEEGRIQCNAATCEIVCDGQNACNGRVCCGNDLDCPNCTSLNGGCCSCGSC